MFMFKKYLTFTIALLAIVTLVSTASYYLTHDDAARSVAVAALVSLLIAGACLDSQFKADPDAVLTFTSVVFLLITICEVVYVLSAHKPGWVPMTMAVVSGFGAVILGVVTYRRQYGPGSPDFPNVLREQFGPTGILEISGIQFTGFVEPGIQDQPHWVSILIQNCFDATRSVRFKFDAEAHSKYLRHYPEFTARLGPAEVRHLRFAVISPTYPGEYHLFFSVGVGGSGGKRVRLWRAKAPDTRIKGGASIALLAAGVLAYGGGLKFKIGPLSTDLWTTDLPAPVSELVWEPKFGTIPRS